MTSSNHKHFVLIIDSSITEAHCLCAISICTRGGIMETRQPMHPVTQLVSWSRGQQEVNCAMEKALGGKR